MPRDSISPERWQRIKEILFAWSVASPEKREAILVEADRKDPSLRVDLEEFLVLEETMDQFIEEPLWSFLPTEDTESSDTEVTQIGAIGRRVGPYRTERLLGHGGMGSVYLAAREDDYEQRVALKWVREDSDNSDILARFYAERQILAHLVHPGIARLLDGGTSEDGRPYLAMEFVEGEPIDRYCEERALSIPDRLELFRKVCAAVHFAHQNLIVHRDLKPNNILVTSDGNPRLLDFGIAKLLQPDLSNHSLATLPGQSPMTPAYASPEQVLAEPITTASDIYSLGVLLYRLLAARPPYHLAGKGYHEVLALICHEYPTRPSLAVLQENPQDTNPPPNPRRLAQKLSGDLDAIVLKAMRKEPGQRYESVAELSEDIHRHLEGLPVQARQGNWLYLTSRLFRRNKPILVAILFVLGFALTTTFLWRQAESQKARAEQEKATARSVTDFLENLFRSANPDEAQGKELTVLEILEKGRLRLDNELQGEPETRSEILGTLGVVYQNLGLFEQGADLLIKALEIRREHDPTDRPKLAMDINNVASNLYLAGDYKRAEKYFREALAMYQRLDPADETIPTIMHNFASTLRLRGQFEEAEAIHVQNLDLRLRTHGPRSKDVATTLYSIGMLKSDQGNLAEAEHLLQQALEIRLEVLGPQHTKASQILDSLGKIFYASGQEREAKKYLEQALEIRLKRQGENHPDVAVSRKNLAEVLLDLGEIDTAGRLAHVAFESLSSSLPTDSIRVADARRVLGTFYLAQEDFPAAEIALNESFLILRKTRGDLAPPTQKAKQKLIQLYREWGKPDQVATIP